MRHRIWARAVVGVVVLLLAGMPLFAGDAFNGRVTGVQTAEVMIVDTGHETFAVRLFAVQAPAEGVLAAAAKQFVEKLVLGNVIRARFEGRRNGQMVSIVGVGDPGVDVGLELVRAGLAQRRPGEDYKYKEMSRAEEEARRERRGLWAKP